jgi:hypothetical protein
LYIGNSGHPTAKNGETTKNLPEELEIGDDSKIYEPVYVNDSYNLDTIPFSAENILDEMTEEDMD